MKRLKSLWVILFFVVLLATTSCSPSPSSLEASASLTPAGVRILNLGQVTPTMMTSGPALPVEASQSPPASPTATTIAATPTRAHTVTATQALIPSPTATDTPTATPACTNRAAFVRHLTVSDNTAFQPTVAFAKLWRIQNTGTCTWSTGYGLVFTGGDAMGAPDFIPLPQEVKPGETVDLRVDMLSPEKPQAYNSEWMLKTSSGVLFGIGDNADQPLLVMIVVRPAGNGGYNWRIADARDCT